MSLSLKEIRLARSRKFNEFTKQILEYEGAYPKTIVRELEKYRRLFIAASNDDDLRELVENDLRWLMLIESYVKFRNTEKQAS